MKLTGLHLLLTYQCNLECDHCFVWGSPHQVGMMTRENIQNILTQAKEINTIKWIYFEGGEPFLYYTILLRGVLDATQLNFKVGIVTNAYWAGSPEEAHDFLKPFMGRIQDFSISSDLYHGKEKISKQAEYANETAEKLGISSGIISIAQPEETNSISVVGQLPNGESKVMYRGRAAEKLTKRANKYPWTDFNFCPHENLQDPGRVHIDSYGNLHICQGITIGNMFDTSLKKICEIFNPDSHPIISRLIKGGPVELVRYYNLNHEDTYADACHLCYEARKLLREKFPEILKPDQMYGVSKK